MSLFTNAANTIQSELKVTKVFAGYEGGKIHFNVDKEIVNPKLCSKTGGFVVDPDRSDVSHVLSILLTAKSTLSSIEVQVYDDYCLDNFVVIRRVAI